MRKAVDSCIKTGETIESTTALPGDVKDDPESTLLCPRLLRHCGETTPDDLAQRPAHHPVVPDTFDYVEGDEPDRCPTPLLRE